VRRGKKGRKKKEKTQKKKKGGGGRGEASPISRPGILRKKDKENHRGEEKPPRPCLGILGAVGKGKKKKGGRPRKGGGRGTNP